MINRSYIAKRNGFTIVELLIVIVIIAILAAITIVAFNGVQARARDAQRTSDLSTIAKALQRWSIETGQDFSAMPLGIGGSIPALGWWDAVYSPATDSVKSALVAGGRLPASINDPINTKASPFRAYMIVPCMSGDNKTRVLLTNMEGAQSQTVVQQIGVNCTDAYFTAYQANYNMDYGRIVKVD